MSRLNATRSTLGNLLGMGHCANCGAALEAAWKFCIVCGTTTAPTVGVVIPGAIRPATATMSEQDDEPDDAPAPRRKKISLSLIIGSTIGVVGMVLIIYVATIVFESRR